MFKIDQTTFLSTLHSMMNKIGRTDVFILSNQQMCNFANYNKIKGGLIFSMIFDDASS